MKSIDLNSDLGEGMPWDEDLMPYISSANIACGAHAGDERTMHKTVQLCISYHVAIGAHPGFADRESFGRAEMQPTDTQLHELITQQLETLNSICAQYQARLHHVKLHGALYNMAARDRHISRVAVQAVKQFNPRLLLYTLSGSVMMEEARRAGLRAVAEAFADRTYAPNGMLLSRNQPHAVLHEPEKALKQALQILKHNTVTAANGTEITISAETLCIHGDEPHAPAIAKKLAETLTQQGYRLCAPRLL
jgi:UPF0271 protein